jgi:hypothetical protein
MSTRDTHANTSISTNPSSKGSARSAHRKSRAGCSECKRKHIKASCPPLNTTPQYFQHPHSAAARRKRESASEDSSLLRLFLYPPPKSSPKPRISRTITQITYILSSVTRVPPIAVVAERIPLNAHILTLFPPSPRSQIPSQLLQHLKR